MKNIFCYEIKPREEDYRVDIIRDGLCEYFFATSFAEGGEGILKCYADVSDYGPVNSYVEMPCRTAVSILLGLLKTMMGAVNRYMLPWNYEISTRSVYADRRGEDVKLIYIPSGEHGRRESMSRILNGFCKALIPQISERDRGAFSEVIKIFTGESMRAEDYLRELYVLQSKLNASLDLCR